MVGHEIILLLFLSIAFFRNGVGITMARFSKNHQDNFNIDELKNISSRITDGGTIDIEQVPFVVRIVVRFVRPLGVAICGGVIIDKKFVLTAGHCVAGTRFDTRGNQPPFECWKQHYYFAPRFVWVLAGGNKNGEDRAMMKSDKEILQDATRLEVRRVLPNCDYMNIHKEKPDFGLLELKEPIPDGNDRIKTIGIREVRAGYIDDVETTDKLPWDSVKDKALVVGWGSILTYTVKDYYDDEVNHLAGVRRQNSLVLLKTELKLTPWKKCLKRLETYTNSDPEVEGYIRFKGPPSLSESEYCVDHNTDGDACDGDSGGPLICYDKKTGDPWLCAIASRGWACGSDLPTLYTIVGFYGVKEAMQRMMKNTNEKCSHTRKDDKLVTKTEKKFHINKCKIKEGRVEPRDTCNCSKILKTPPKKP